MLEPVTAIAMPLNARLQVRFAPALRRLSRDSSATGTSPFTSEQS